MEGRLRNMTAVYLLRGEQVLLLFRQGGRVVSDVWTGSAGGHFEPSELNDAKACVLREMHEELGLDETDVENLTLRYITLRQTNGEIRQNYYFFARLKEEADCGLKSNEGRLQWFGLNETSGLKMPHTAQYVVKHYCAEGQFTDRLYVGATYAGGVNFMELPDC